MASRYRKKFALPEDFMEILEAYSKEVLRDQPMDIVEFSYLYFKALEEVSRFASILFRCLMMISHNCRVTSKALTTQGKARTSHPINLTDHPRPKTKRVRKNKTKHRVTTTKTEIRSRELMKKEKKASTERKAKMAMDKNRHRMVNNKSNMAKRDRITMKKERIMASNNDFSRQLNTIN